MIQEPIFWLAVGFVGQGLFTARFVVQWLASERSGKVVVPAAFWWLSLAGASALLAYSIRRADPVFTLGQSMGVFIYVRNLMLESRKAGRPATADAPATSPPAPHFAAEAAREAAGRA